MLIKTCMHGRIALSPHDDLSTANHSLLLWLPEPHPPAQLAVLGRARKELLEPVFGLRRRHRHGERQEVFGRGVRLAIHWVSEEGECGFEGFGRGERGGDGGHEGGGVGRGATANCGE
jgi:hypothetical protein